MRRPKDCPERFTCYKDCEECGFAKTFEKLRKLIKRRDAKIQELKELIRQAMELPCPIGTNVYYVKKNWGFYSVCLRTFTVTMLSKYGKTVFLTLEEAEAGIKKLEQEDAKRARRNKANTKKKAENICWACKHSVPNPEKGTGCPWSLHGEPVKGWTREKLKVITTNDQDGKPQQITKEFVTECPLFKRG